MPCPDCSKRVVVKVNENETLTFTCPECDSTAYVKKGAGNYAAWISKIEKVAAPAPAPSPTPTPVGKQPKTAFGY
jgi:hypothetical protein